MNHLSYVISDHLSERGNYEDAERHLQEAIKTVRDYQSHANTVEFEKNLAELLEKKGDRAGAIAAWKRALAINRRIVPEEHPIITSILQPLARLLEEEGDHEAAEPLLRRVQEAQEELLRKDPHEKVLMRWDFEGLKDCPSGWSCWSQKGAFEVGLVPTPGQPGGTSAFIGMKGPNPTFISAGYLTYSLNARAYRGKRLRLRARLKAEGSKAAPGLWLRVDGSDGEKLTDLAFDNMSGRPIRGPADWRTYQVVLDVPEESVRISFGAHYGAAYYGGGRAYIDDITLEEVDERVPVTDLRTYYAALDSLAGRDKDE